MDGLTDKVFHLAGLRDVGFYENALASAPPNLLCSLISPGSVDIRSDHLGSFFREQDGRPSANTRGCSCNHGNFVLESHAPPPTRLYTDITSIGRLQVDLTVSVHLTMVRPTKTMQKCSIFLLLSLT